MGVNGIYGLSGSGLDVESLVKMGMKGKQNQYDKMYKREMTNEYTKTALNELYNKVNTYNLSELTNYKKQSDMAAKSASSSDDKKITVSANGAAAVMSHTVTVQSLASNAYFMSNAPITRSYQPDPSDPHPPRSPPPHDLGTPREGDSRVSTARSSAATAARPRPRSSRDLASIRSRRPGRPRDGHDRGRQSGRTCPFP